MFTIPLGQTVKRTNSKLNQEYYHARAHPKKSYEHTSSFILKSAYAGQASTNCVNYFQMAPELQALQARGCMLCSD